MNRISFLIDGFNLYHSLEENRDYHKYKWLNIRKLCECFVSSKSEIASVKYFSAYATWIPDKYQRHMQYVRALKSTSVEVILGKFKKKTRLCLTCRKYYLSHEEKRTDVNIAIQLLLVAMNDECDTIIIVSGDSDLIPAIQAVKSYFPNKKIGIIIPIGRVAVELENEVDFRMRIKEHHLRTSQFDDVIDLGKGVSIQRPVNWK
jgi:uncharacterized LabA/DUF88 family protein